MHQGRAYANYRYRQDSFGTNRRKYYKLQQSTTQEAWAQDEETYYDETSSTQASRFLESRPKTSTVQEAWTCSTCRVRHLSQDYYATAFTFGQGATCGSSRGKGTFTILLCVISLI